MKGWILVCVLTLGMGLGGCDDDEGGAGGAGGGVAPTFTEWGITDVEVVQDDCIFGPLSGDVEIATDGTNATMIIVDPAEPGRALEVSTDAYSPDLTTVVMTGQFDNDREPPCVARLLDEFTLTVDDSTLSLPDNDTLSVEWDHIEEDVSDGECEGIWFVPLPCETFEDFTLEKLVE